jgi:enoyl-CoA hydratase
VGVAAGHYGEGMFHVEQVSHGTAPNGSIVIATIDRQERRNAVDAETLNELSRTLDTMIANPAARVFVLRGAGGHFSAGADLSSVDSGEFRALLVEAVSRLAAAPVVTMAQIDGFCLGAGLQLATACDFRVASDESIFGIPAAKLGVAVDQSTVDRLVDLVGGGLTRSILLAAELVDASTALASGLIHRRGTYDDAVAWAESIAHLAPLSQVAHKMALSSRSHTVTGDALVAEAIERAWRSADSVEGRAAFAERRSAIFTGR